MNCYVVWINIHSKAVSYLSAVIATDFHFRKLVNSQSSPKYINAWGFKSQASSSTSLVTSWNIGLLSMLMYSFHLTGFYTFSNTKASFSSSSFFIYFKHILHEC